MARRLLNPAVLANVGLACFWLGLAVGSGDYTIWNKYAALSAGLAAAIFIISKDVKP